MSGVIDPKVRKTVTTGAKNLKLTPPGSTGGSLGSVPMTDGPSNKATKRLAKRSQQQEKALRKGLGF